MLQRRFHFINKNSTSLSLTQSASFLICQRKWNSTKQQKQQQQTTTDANRIVVYKLNRVDTYGNKYVISTHANKEDAEKEFRKLMEVPHKQGYDIEEVEI